MTQDLKWLLQRMIYCFLLAQAYWWETGKFSLIIFWSVTTYVILNYILVLSLRRHKIGLKFSYDSIINSMMDIIPALAVISTISFHSLFLSSFLGVVYGKFFIQVCFMFQKKEFA